MKKVHHAIPIILLTVFVSATCVWFLHSTLSNRGYVTPSPIEAAVQGGDYLVRHFNHDAGTFDYLFDARTGATSTAYNLLRHAGTTYALLGLYEHTGTEAYRNTAARAIAFTAAQENPCPKPYEALTCVYEAGAVKLGGNALALLALTEYIRVTNDQSLLPKAQGYAAWIVKTQDASGNFTVQKQDTQGRVEAFASSYYPGEAIFALMRLYALDHNETWHSAARLGADWLIVVRDAGKGTAEIEHDHWLLYGLNELYREQPDEKYLAHARLIVDAIGATQHVHHANPAWDGGFYDPPRSTPTATRVEGLMAAHTLFVYAGDMVYAERAHSIAERAVPFELRTLVTRSRITRNALVTSSLGGFTADLEDPEIRIDYVQHNISALLGYTSLLEQSAKVR